MDAPETLYARNGDVSIAYQVFGSGSLDLVYIPGFVSNIDAMWQYDPLATFLRGLAAFARVIVLDKRGTGLSDRVAVQDLPTLEQRMDDVRAVMDAAGSKRAALFGHSEGSLMSILFAATYPSRLRALVLYGAFAKRIRTEDYPWAPTFEQRQADWESVGQTWGTIEGARRFLLAVDPEQLRDERRVRWLAGYLRSAASPAAAAAIVRMNSFMDVRHVLPAVRVPTLILHGTADTDVSIEEARWVASRIPEARFVEIPLAGHLFWSAHADVILGELQEFLTGVRPPLEPDRSLATVLFTDIVRGTEKAAELGDRGWGALIERHHAVVRGELARFRGREVDTAGDGFFATFDGPGRAARCAVAAREALRPLGIEIRAGLHTGECEEIAGKVGGMAVIIGARVKEQAGVGEVLASSTVKDLVVGSGIEFEDLGSRTLKGVPGDWRLYRVVRA